MANLGHHEEFPIRRAATYPAATTQFMRCPFYKVHSRLILLQDDGDHLSEVLHRYLPSIMLRPGIAAVFDQFMEALLQGIARPSSLRPSSTSTTERRPRPTQLHIDPLVAASSSGAIPSSSTPSNRRNPLAPYSPTPSTSSAASVHDDLHDFW